MFGEVTATERLSPSMVRIVLGGPGLDDFHPTGFSDEYVNILVVPDDAPYGVPFDLEAVKELGAQARPHRRRFTVRHWDAAARRLTIDFVAHGEVGHAGRWAQRASVGDRLQLAGPSGGYRPEPTADWHLMAGDESALPAIAASLDVLAAGAVAHVFVVVDGPEHELELASPGDVRLRWLHRSTAADPDTLLLDAIAAHEFPPGTPQVFVHGEAGEVRAVRRHLLIDRGLDKEGTSISPYWRRDHTDEAWRAIKKQWQAEVNAEA